MSTRKINTKNIKIKDSYLSIKESIVFHPKNQIPTNAIKISAAQSNKNKTRGLLFLWDMFLLFIVGAFAGMHKGLGDSKCDLFNATLAPQKRFVGSVEYDATFN